MIRVIAKHVWKDNPDKLRFDIQTEPIKLRIYIMRNTTLAKLYDEGDEEAAQFVKNMLIAKIYEQLEVEIV